LHFYAYISNNPVKVRLLLVEAINSSDGIAVSWLGHVVFQDRSENELYGCRTPTFFETFPVLVLNKEGVSTCFYGGELDDLTFTDPVTVKKYAQCAQLGEIFEFDHATIFN